MPPHEQAALRPNRPSNAALGFIGACFAVVGLVGIMASAIAPLPLERALQRQATLDAVLVAAAGADPASALEKLRTRLADSAAAILPRGQGGGLAEITARVAAERGAMLARFETEQAELTLRLRLLIVVVSLMGAGFGIAVAAMPRGR